MKLLESKWQSEYYTSLGKTKKFRQSFTKTARHISNQSFHDRKSILFNLKYAYIPTKLWKNNKIFKRYEPNLHLKNKLGRKRKIFVHTNSNHIR